MSHIQVKVREVQKCHAFIEWPLTTGKGSFQLSIFFIVRLIGKMDKKKTSIVRLFRFR
jgi:hypothetical protein